MVFRFFHIFLRRSRVRTLDRNEFSSPFSVVNSSHHLGNPSIIFCMTYNFVVIVPPLLLKGYLKNCWWFGRHVRGSFGGFGSSQSQLVRWWFLCLILMTKPSVFLFSKVGICPKINGLHTKWSKLLLKISAVCHQVHGELNTTQSQVKIVCQGYLFVSPNISKHISSFVILTKKADVVC